METFESLKQKVLDCKICAEFLPYGVHPVFQIHPQSKILIAGQAPGKKVHESGIPFDDASGDRLRDWMGITRETFYDQTQIAILPMGFCYPGKGKSGDLPPRPECAPAWRQKLIDYLPHLVLTIIIGQYAVAWHLKDYQTTITERVKSWRTFLPEMITLPHPSPRNNIWLKRNPWFESELLPALRNQVTKVLDKNK